MRISPTKFISLLFLVLSVFYLYTAYNIQVFAFDENAPFNARTFTIYLGWAWIILSSLKIILPEKVTTEVNHKHLDYKSIIYLIIISLIYAAVILKIGYFISTSLFLFASYYFLGERRWGLMFVLSFPFVAAFMYLLHGLLNIYLRDPFLKYIGVMGWSKEY